MTACWYDINEPAEQQRVAARREARARRLAKLDATAQALFDATTEGQADPSPDGHTAARMSRRGRTS